jgi:hypothetical protein
MVAVLPFFLKDEDDQQAAREGDKQSEEQAS